MNTFNSKFKFHFKFNSRRFWAYTSISLATGVTLALLIETASFLHRFINALFIASLVSLLPGLVLISLRLGAFDLFVFGFCTLRRYSAHFMDEEGEPSPSYHSFKMEKPVRHIHSEPLTLGIVLLLLSILMSVVFA